MGPVSRPLLSPFTPHPSKQVRTPPRIPPLSQKKPHSSSIQKLPGTHSGQGGTGTIFHYFLRFKSGPKKSSLALLGGSLTYELINLCISESICSHSLTFVLFESPYTAESYKWKHVSSLRGCELGLIPTQKPFHFHTRSTLEGLAQS